MDLNSPKSCNMADRIPSSTSAGDCPTSLAISKLVIPDKNASSIIRCCRGGIASSAARTSRRCSVMLIEEVALVLAVLFRNVSLLVVSCLQRRSMARRCAMSISQVSGRSFCLRTGRLCVVLLRRVQTRLLPLFECAPKYATRDRRGGRL